MTASERSIMRAVLRYNGIPDAEHKQHIEMSLSNQKGSLSRAAFLSYRIIWNSFTPEQRIKLCRPQ
jgi:hypothetical protein